MTAQSYEQHDRLAKNAAQQCLLLLYHHIMAPAFEQDA
jgi:hypothetical protein